MSSVNYKNLPKVTILYSNANMSYATISYYGNTTATSTPIISGNLSSGSGAYTTPDLSFNTLYTFTIIPYNNLGIAGTSEVSTVNTTPKVTGVYTTNTTTSNAQIQWYGTYSYVKIYRKITAPYTTAYVDVSAGTTFSTIPYYDTDLSGNTTYSYIIRPYDINNYQYSDTDAISLTTEAQAAQDLSAIYYDSSSIQIKFTAPKNSYSTSYYYQLNASGGTTITNISGITTPLYIGGLNSNTNYSCYITGFLDGILRSTSDILNVNTLSVFSSNFILSNVDYVDSGSGYNFYVFKKNASIKANIINTVPIYIFAVGGGGAGGSGNGAGGGGGGVVKSLVNVSGSDIIHITVGNGGMAPPGTSGVGTNGFNTTVNFKTYSSNNIVAYGGGAGGVYTSLGSTAGIAGGSGGGGSSTSGGAANTTNNNIAKAGGSGYSYWGTGGGGGAGTAGSNGTTGSGTAATSSGGNGGNGVRFIDISNISPTTFPINNFTAYSNYYWSGGGGGSCTTGPAAGNGGLGGGGGGIGQNNQIGNGGGNSINSGGNGIATGGIGGNGGYNTGGGGGGSYSNSQSGGSGGSGIVILAIPTTTLVTLNTSLSVNNITTTAYNSLKCIYGCNLLNANYTGPIFKLRYSTDATGANASDFYCDNFGRYTTGANNTGTTLYSWLSSAGANTTYAYIVKWYDQSVINTYDASQTVLASQPIFDIQNQVVNFNYSKSGYGVMSPQTTSYFNAPTNTWPTGDTSYTFTFKHYNFTPNQFGIVQGGNLTTNGLFFPSMKSTSTYCDNWNGPTYTFGTAVPNNTVTMYYTTGYAANSMIGYVNNVRTASYSPGSARSNLNTNNTVGTVINSAGAGWVYSTIQINYIYCFNQALSTTDRNTIEGSIYNNIFPTSCVYDFDANYGVTTSAGSVTSWVDYYNGYVATGATNKPTYVANVQGGLGMLSFPVNNTYVTTSTVLGNSPNTVNSTTNITLFVVLKTPATMTETYYIGNNSTGNLQVGFLSSKMYFGTSNVGAFITNGPFTAVANTVYLLAFNVSSISTASPYAYSGSFYKNGVFDCSLSASMTSKFIYKNSWFGTAYNGYSNGYLGSIGEIILFNTSLGVNDMSNVTNYLSNKWSIPIGSTPTVYPINPFLY